MTRLLLAALLLAAAPLARADDAPPRPALTRDDLQLLSFTEAEWLRFQRANADLAVRAEVLLKRAERVDELLRARAEDAGTQALREERARLAAQSEPLAREVEERLARAGKDPAMLERARRAPRGPCRPQRFARSQVLAFLAGAEGPPARRALLERLAPRVDGAVMVLDEQPRREVERRFWRLVYWLFPDEERARLMERLPLEVRKVEDAIAHVYLLRGLTPSQGVAIKALLLELEAEAAADTAELKRATDDASRKAAQERLVELQLSAADRGLALLTPEQVLELRSLPAYVSGPDRSRRVEETLEGFALDPAQRAALAALGARYLADRRRYEAGALDVQRRLAEAGPDSPEREMAEMMYVALSGEVVRTLRQAHAEVMLDILTPDQVEAWVLGLPLR
jgi:hypothetical protein